MKVLPVYFFFSSRRRHTRYIGDWSSDVCSSDLIDPEYLPFIGLMFVGLVLRFWDLGYKALHHDESLHAFYAWRLFDGQGYVHDPMRSEERRVGKEWRARPARAAWTHGGRPAQAL